MEQNVQREFTVVSRLQGTWFFQENSFLGWKVNAEIKVHLITKYFCTTTSWYQNFSRTYSWRPSVSGDNGVAPMVSLWWSCSAGCGCRDRSSSGRSCCSCCMRRRCRPRGMGWPLLSGACELSCLPTAPLFSALLSWWLTWWWIASRCGPLPVLRSLLAQCHPPSGPAWAHPCSGAKVVQWVWTQWQAHFFQALFSPQLKLCS